MGRTGNRCAVVLGLAVLLHCLTGCGRHDREPAVTFETVESIPSQTTEAGLQLPCTLPDSGLVAEELICYDGPYWEDGSGEPVQNVAALMLYNPGERMVEFAAVSLGQGDRQRYFFAYRLPPKSRCLVLERNRMPYTDEEVTACRELSIRWEYQELSREQLNYLGFGKKLTVINRESRQQDHITLWYKRYVEEGDYYLGGIAYSAHLFYLQPQECRVLTPDYYDAANTRVVAIRMGER